MRGLLASARRAGLWCLAAALAASACGDTPSSEAECDTTCARLDACGFLPSPIAPDLGDSLRASCEERCVETEPELVDEVSSCMAVVRPESPARWCATNNGKGSPCEQAATCMQRIGHELSITGEVGLRLVARIGTSIEHAPQLTEPPTACSAAEPDDDTGVLALGPLCDRLGIDEIEYFVKQGVELAPKRYQCAAGFERGAQFKLEPGPVIAGVRLQGTILAKVEQEDGTTETESQPACITYYAPATVLVAGKDVELPIYLPENRPALAPDACPQAADAVPTGS